MLHVTCTTCPYARGITLVGKSKFHSSAPKRLQMIRTLCFRIHNVKTNSFLRFLRKVRQRYSSGTFNNSSKYKCKDKVKRQTKRREYVNNLSRDKVLRQYCSISILRKAKTDE